MSNSPVMLDNNIVAAIVQSSLTSVMIFRGIAGWKAGGKLFTLYECIGLIMRPISTIVPNIKI